MANSEILKKIKDMGTVAKNSKVLKNIKDMGTSVSNSKLLNQIKNIGASTGTSTNPLNSTKVRIAREFAGATPRLNIAPSNLAKGLSGPVGAFLALGMSSDDSSEIKDGRPVPAFDFKRSAADNKLSDAIGKKFATPAAPTSTQPSTPKDDKQKKPQNTTKGSGSGSSSSSKPVTYGTNLLTTEQVKDLQRSSGGVLKVDGIVGPKTRAYAQQINMPLTKEQFNAQPKVSEQVVVSSAEIPYTGKYSSMENAAIFNNLPSNVTLQEAKKQAVTPVEPGLASTQFNANDFKRFDDIRALQADQGMSELEATARYGQGMRPNATGLADAVTLNKAPVPVVPVSKGANPNQVLSDNLVKATKRQQNGY
jgi:hypothetical protein